MPEQGEARGNSDGLKSFQRRLGCKSRMHAVASKMFGLAVIEISVGINVEMLGEHALSIDSILKAG